MNNLPVEYLSCEIAKNTKYKMVKDAYERNNFSVIKRGGVFWIESCPSNKVYTLLVKETKRLYPYLTYLYEN